MPPINVQSFLSHCACMFGFTVHLHSLSSLLCICQQLDGDSPAVLHGVLQVNEGVAHMMAHTALPADRH